MQIRCSLANRSLANRSFANKQPVFLCWLLVLTLWITGCSDSPSANFHTYSGPTMGTWYNVKVQEIPKQLTDADVQSRIQQVLENINQLMSTYVEDSELSRFNRHPVNQPMTLSPETLAVMRISQQVFRESGGVFDITVGPLVNLWGFGPQGNNQVPGDEQIRQALNSIGSQQVELAESSATKLAPRTLDLSAVAKGYAVDKVAQGLEELGITRYMVDVGGEVKVGDKKLSGEPWKIAIEEPITFERVIQRVLTLQSVAVATSGDYRNFFEQDGKRYSHTIDPRTGAPVEHNLASVTVIHQSCAFADAYATAITVLGPEEGLAFAERLNLAVYLLVKQGDGFTALQTDAFSAYVE